MRTGLPAHGQAPGTGVDRQGGDALAGRGTTVELPRVVGEPEPGVGPAAPVLVGEEPLAVRRPDDVRHARPPAADLRLAAAHVLGEPRDVDDRSAPLRGAPVPRLVHEDLTVRVGCRVVRGVEDRDAGVRVEAGVVVLVRVVADELALVDHQVRLPQGIHLLVRVRGGDVLPHRARAAALPAAGRDDVEDPPGPAFVGAGVQGDGHVRAVTVVGRRPVPVGRLVLLVKVNGSVDSAAERSATHASKSATADPATAALRTDTGLGTGGLAYSSVASSGAWETGQ